MMMYALQENLGLSQVNLVENLGASLRGINCCREDLIYKRFVKMQNFQSINNKSKYIYRITLQSNGEKVALKSRFLVLKFMSLYLKSRD